jgi:hypothetical protein
MADKLPETKQSNIHNKYELWCIHLNQSYFFFWVLFLLQDFFAVYFDAYCCRLSGMIEKADGTLGRGGAERNKRRGNVVIVDDEQPQQQKTGGCCGWEAWMLWMIIVCAFVDWSEWARFGSLDAVNDQSVNVFWLDLTGGIGWIYLKV